MDPRMAWVGAMGIALACGGMSGPEERVDQSSSNANFRQGSYTSSTPSVDLFSACAPTKVSSLNEGVFVPNPWCTMPSTFDPTIGAPSAAALVQLAPTGVLRVGVYYGNFGLAVRDPNTGVLSGTAVDISCRLATQLKLPLQFTAYPTIPTFQAGFAGGTWEIGFGTDPTFNIVPGSIPTNTYEGIENTLLVPAASPIMIPTDADKPGVNIAVQKGNAPDLFMRANFHNAKLIELVSANPIADIFPLVKSGVCNTALCQTSGFFGLPVHAAAGGRAGETIFVQTSYPDGRVLPGTLYLAKIGPFIRPNNGDALCYLDEYIEAARASGLFAEVIARQLVPRIMAIVTPAEPGCSPAVTCKSVTAEADASCQANASILASATDADSDLAGCTQSPAGPYPLGTTKVTLTCKDTDGNSSTCSATVTVVDTTPPVIVCPADQTLECTDEVAQPNPNCTMPGTWDPCISAPSSCALDQLAPTGTLRVGIYTGNFLNATVNPVTGALSGPAIDVFCRFAAQLNLPLEFTTYPTVQQAQTGFDSGVWEIGASTDQFGTIVGAAPANAYAAINTTLMVDNASPIMMVTDADQPGIQIAVQAGIATDIYLRNNFTRATLVEIVTGSPPTDVFPLVQQGRVNAAAGGRSGLTSFVASHYPNGRVLSDTLVDIQTSPYVHPNNEAARCYLNAYVEGAKTSGLLFQAWSRLTPAQQFGTGVPPAQALCVHSK